jgi:hypothetical protein
MAMLPHLEDCGAGLVLVMTTDRTSTILLLGETVFPFSELPWKGE